MDVSNRKMRIRAITERFQRFEYLGMNIRNNQHLLWNINFTQVKVDRIPTTNHDVDHMLQNPPEIIGNCMNLDVDLNTYVMKPDHEESVICANQALKVQHTETIHDLSHQKETLTRNGGGEVTGLDQSDQEDGHYPDSPDITSCKSIYEIGSDEAPKENTIVGLSYLDPNLTPIATKSPLGSDEAPKENTIIGLSYLDPNPTPIATKSPPLDLNALHGLSDIANYQKKSSVGLFSATVKPQGAMCALNSKSKLHAAEMQRPKSLFGSSAAMNVDFGITLKDISSFLSNDLKIKKAADCDSE